MSVYVLELENGKYYVGRSNNVLHMLMDHVAARDYLSIRSDPPQIVLETFQIFVLVL